jgi:hypothetical protein
MIRFGTGRHNGTGIPLRETPDLAELDGRSIEFEAELLGEARQFVGNPIQGKTAYSMRVAPFRKVIMFAEPGLACSGVVVGRGAVFRQSEPGPKGRFTGPSNLVQHQIDAESVHCRN